MEIFGIGPLELIYILLIALIILGPRDMVKAGRALGRFLRRIVMSPSWRTVQHASQEFRHLPSKLIREAGLEELEENVNEINKISKSYLDNVKRNELDLQDIQDFQIDMSSWTTPPPSEEVSESSSNNAEEMESDAQPEMNTSIESSQDSSTPDENGQKEDYADK
jgi:Sec-independent protein translocase protein TatA